MQLAPNAPPRSYGPAAQPQRPIAPSYRTMRQAAQAGVQPLGTEVPALKTEPAAAPVPTPSRMDPVVVGVLSLAVVALIGIVFVLRRAGQGASGD